MKYSCCFISLNKNNLFSAYLFAEAFTLINKASANSLMAFNAGELSRAFISKEPPLSASLIIKSKGITAITGKSVCEMVNMMFIRFRQMVEMKFA